MFIAIVFIAIGLALLLSSLNIITGSFWGFFWAIILIAFGVKMLNHKKACPFCKWEMWKETCDHHRHHHDHKHEEDNKESEPEM